jgi:hypothetical protein
MGGAANKPSAARAQGVCGRVGGHTRGKEQNILKQQAISADVQAPPGYYYYYNNITLPGYYYYFLRQAGSGFQDF